ncbi:MAG: GNAT family N-acetyltransferase [Planctomycetota bacterium]
MQSPDPSTGATRMEIKRAPQEKSTRISLLADSEDVSGLWVHDLTMRIGTVPVRMGGIGGVSTKPDHRKKGYARKVLEDAVGFMRESGYDVSALFGIPDFYPRFGYAVCMPECECSLSTRDAERAEQSLEWSVMSDADAPAVLALYDETNRARTGTLVRVRARFVSS